MIRFENHVPDTYVVQSRDFQLFVAVFDYFQNAVKFRIDTMEDLCDTQRIQDSLLPYLQTKLGFFTVTSIPLSLLRTILKVFVTIVRNKGSKIGILLAVNTFLNAQHELARATVDIDTSTHTIYIATTTVLRNRNILEEILQYVVPAGYNVAYSLLYNANLVWEQTVRDSLQKNYWTTNVFDSSDVYQEAVSVLPEDVTNSNRIVDTTFIATNNSIPENNETQEETTS